jgi:outer membrane protein assembly factor BamB
MNYPQPSVKTIRLLRNIAIVCTIFATLLCVLIIINYLQSKRTDPLNSKTLTILNERLKTNPEDQQLRDEIREFDLLARKAFFTNRWQVKTGGLLLFFNVLVIILCLQAIDYMKKKIPEIPPDKIDNFWSNRKINRKWVAGSGITLVLIALVFGFLSHNDLEKTLEKEKLPAGKSGSQELRKSGGQEVRRSGSQKVEITSDNQFISSSVITEKDTLAGQMAIVQEGIPSSDLSADWPGFRGPGGNGIAYQKNIPVKWDGKNGKNIKWKTEIPLPGYNSPVIWKDRIFLSGANENKREVYCIDLNSGKILWRTAVAKIPGSPEQAPKVNRETGFSAPTVTTDGIRVYTIFANGDIIALDLNGKKVWDKNLGLPKNHYGHSSSLIIYKDKVIVQYDQTGNACVMALYGKNGEVAWKTTRNVRVSWASPILVNTKSRMELILAADPYVASYDPENGKELWKIDCISGEVGPSPAYADGVVYSINEYSKLAAIKTGDTPEILWEDNEYLSDVPSPVATGKYLFLVTSYGVAVCYDAKTGSKYWFKEFGNTIYASPVLADRKIYLLNSKGKMYIFNADKTFSLVGEPQLGEGSFCTPAFIDGGIIIRGDKNLYCIGN